MNVHPEAKAVFFAQKAYAEEGAEGPCQTCEGKRMVSLKSRNSTTGEVRTYQISCNECDARADLKDVRRHVQKINAERTLIESRKVDKAAKRERFSKLIHFLTDDLLG